MRYTWGLRVKVQPSCIVVYDAANRRFVRSRKDRFHAELVG